MLNYQRVYSCPNDEAVELYSKNAESNRQWKWWHHHESCAKSERIVSSTKLALDHIHWTPKWTHSSFTTTKTTSTSRILVPAHACRHSQAAKALQLTLAVVQKLGQRHSCVAVDAAGGHLCPRPGVGWSQLY